MNRMLTAVTRKTTCALLVSCPSNSSAEAGELGKD